MLPSAKQSLMTGGYSSKEAAWMLIACFMGGVVGIQILSRAMHHFVPHNVVDCEHTHEDEEAPRETGGTHDHEHVGCRDHEHSQGHDHHTPEDHTDQSSESDKKAFFSRNMSRPQMQQRPSSQQPYQHGRTASSLRSSHANSHVDPHSTSSRRPSFQSQISGTISKLTSKIDPSCDCDGPCYGFSGICQSHCFKSVNSRGGIKVLKPTTGVNRPSILKCATATESTPLLHNIVEEPIIRPHTRAANENVDLPASDSDVEHGRSDHSSATLDGQAELHKTHSHATSTSSHHIHTHDRDHDHDHSEQSADQPHHHHVPTNAFLNIGLQTSIAIALHKLPEGFITYATNHANPKLGVSVFLALFIHNITEGFAMALPLYLAINNRLKAMVISFVLGGLSQPLGAGVAALWFKLAGKHGWTPNEAGYGAMFAVTAGIMASVALQLFAESLDLTHSKHLCMIGAFTGMFILGCSSALTA